MGLPPERSSSQDCRFQPCQIVCLEDEVNYLYAEVVQTVVQRQICWVRPLILLTKPLDASFQAEAMPSQWYDLRHGADLLLPLTLFRAALDSEVIPLLAHLYHLDSEAGVDKADPNGHKSLSQFIQRLCCAHPEAFSCRDI